MKLTFLGTGTSFGIPVVGCGCRVCASADPRDRRSRHAALISWEDGGRVLVDTPPELRLQLLRAGVEHVDAVWFTHVHADHIHGIDDLRIFSLRTGRSLPAYASEDARAVLQRRFDYIFDQPGVTERGVSKPQITLNALQKGRTQMVAEQMFLPLEVQHGSQKVMGFRVAGLGYVTDAKKLPPQTVEALMGVQVLVLNALWWGDPHPSHFNVEEAVSTARVIGARRTFLTHLTHRVSHEDLVRSLPEGVQPAYDGLSVEVPEGGELPAALDLPSADAPRGAGR